MSQSPPRQLVKKRRTILEDDDLFAFRRVDPDALSRRESNAFVQKVLDAHRFGFTLLDHQYEAARCVAGLPYLWPRTLVNDRADDTLEQAPLTADRHLILADQMGLGKTVSTLAGAVLRRAVAAFHSRHAPKAVLVITPNAAVMHQWSEHIDRAHGFVHVYGGGGARDGKLKARLELYEKEAARGGEVRTLVVLTTKYAVQSAAMDACNFSAPKPCALFPHLSRKDLMKLGLLKFAAADAERFLDMVEGGKLGEAGRHVADLLEKLLHAVYDNADPHAAAPIVAAAPQPLDGAARGRAVDWKPPKREPADRAGGPVPFDYAAVVGDPWGPLKREPKAEARAAAPAVIDLRGDSDVEMMVAAPKAQQAPIEIDSDAEGPSPIAVDADGEPWTCARCTYAENRPCFLCCEMCGGERAS